MTGRDDSDQKKRIEREARLRRRGDLAGALAGADGGANLRGASPTPLAQRITLELEQWLQAHLDDPETALRSVLLRRLTARTEGLETFLGRPAALVAERLPNLLASPSALAEFVREVDMSWGRLYQERPHFERPGETPHTDDPYTIAGVTALLERLLARARSRA